jgi:hypothetical protein
MANEANGVRRPPGRGTWRRVAFRLAAILLGLAPLVAAEGLFRLLDWGRPTYRDDPFVGFSAVRPLFIRSEDGSRWEIAPSRRMFFRPASFPAAKAPGTYRIFCLGGSTVLGHPFAVETSFTTWLQIDLEAADPDRRWEVINCGGISYASYRLVPILEEVLRHEADLVIVYTGHNEFLEDRQYAPIRDLPRAVAWPWELLLQTRTYNLLRAGYERLAGPQDAPEGRPILGPEADAMLDWQGGFDRYHRDERLREGVIRHFRCNLERMVGIARDAGVPLILANPVSNLRD